jgi:hypothetical protein
MHFDTVQLFSDRALNQQTDKFYEVRFQVSKAASMKTAFKVIATCSLVEVDRSFGGTYCLHHQGDDDTGRTYE